MEIVYLECECNCSEHLMRFISYDGEEEIYIEYYLNPEVSFWKRLKIAIRYLFNRKCKFGAFDEVIVNKERLKDLLNKL